MNETLCYAQVAIDTTLQKLDHPFTYRIPLSLQRKISLGSLVLVPFGKGNALRKGYVIDLLKQCDLPGEKVKEIADVEIQGKDDMGKNAIQLASWMKDRYGSTLSCALKTILSGRKQAKPVEKKTVVLLLDESASREKLVFYDKKHQVARKRLLTALMQTPIQPYSFLTNSLHVASSTITALQKQGVVRIDRESALRNPVSLQKTDEEKLVLTNEQQSVVDGILKEFNRAKDVNDVENSSFHRVSLIHGVTGSGKTEVYISIIEQIVAQGYQAIMLIPEISLTYQTLIRFYRHFGDRVSILHSRLSSAEKSDQFERARRGEIDVIIGPRSALFTPFPHLGVIVIDEEHESSYKNESMPKYHAREVAVELARLHGGIVVLGSATPSIDSYDRALHGEYRLYTLNHRPKGGKMASAQIVDIRQEIREGNPGILSRTLSLKIQEKLDQKEQVMLFLNRRGFSGFVSCRNCGYVPKCPHCSVSLSLHSNGKLLCHYCGYEEKVPMRCPSCGSPHIRGYHVGTEQVEKTVKSAFPHARILRMDADTTKKKGSYEKILSTFANEEADILLGTQMIVKGHDFPKVTLVGILAADLSLHAQDYRASERTFQLLTQAGGRAGRGDKEGEVIIQTMEPDHYSIRYAAKQDYVGFYEEEIQYRRLLNYPPASHMLAIEVLSKNEDHVKLFAEKTKTLLEKQVIRGSNDISIIGPSAASLEKLRDEYRYALYIKCEEYDKLVDCKDAAEAAQNRARKADQRFDVSFQFDFDPINPF